MKGDMAPKLKPCPFCGKQPEISYLRYCTRWDPKSQTHKEFLFFSSDPNKQTDERREHHVCCRNKRCRVQPGTDHYGRRERAVQAWNTRRGPAG